MGPPAPPPPRGRATSGWTDRRGCDADAAASMTSGVSTRMTFGPLSLALFFSISLIVGPAGAMTFGRDGTFITGSVAGFSNFSGVSAAGFWTDGSLGVSGFLASGFFGASTGRLERRRVRASWPVPKGGFLLTASLSPTHSLAAVRRPVQPESLSWLGAAFRLRGISYSGRGAARIGIIRIARRLSSWRRHASDPCLRQIDSFRCFDRRAALRPRLRRLRTTRGSSPPALPIRSTCGW